MKHLYGIQRVVLIINSFCGGVSRGVARVHEVHEAPSSLVNALVVATVVPPRDTSDWRVGTRTLLERD